MKAKTWSSRPQFHFIVQLIKYHLIATRGFTCYHSLMVVDGGMDCNKISRVAVAIVRLQTPN